MKTVSVNGKDLELKPCPFCGEDEQEMEELEDGNYEIRCSYCDGRGPRCGTRAYAISEWNKRHDKEAT